MGFNLFYDTQLLLISNITIEPYTIKTMKRFSHYAKLVAALLLLGSMLVFGIFIFALLLFVAIITSIALSLKRKEALASTSTEAKYDFSDSKHEAITIIDGEAEEVTKPSGKERGATSPLI